METTAAPAAKDAAAAAVPNPATPAAEEPEQPLYSTAELLQRAAARRQQLEVELVAIAEQRAKLEKALEVVRLRQQQAKLSSLGAASKGNITGAASKKGRGPGSAAFSSLAGSGGSGAALGLAGAGGSLGGQQLAPPPPPPLDEEPAAKRARLEHERERRLALIWQQCSTVAKTLMRHRDSAPFHRPVDPVALKCPDYLTIIKRPMDLGTALAKLDPPKSGPLGGALQPAATRRAYSSPLEFRDDVRLMFANCRTYNKVGTPVRRMGDGLCDLWEKKWASSGVEQKWEAEQERARDEELEASGASAAAVRMRKLDRDLRAVNAVAATAAGFGLGTPNGVPPPRPGAGGAAERDMTFEEKRRLSQSLGMLPADKLGRALDIVADAVKGQMLAAKEKKRKEKAEKAAKEKEAGGDGAAATAAAAAAGEKASALDKGGDKDDDEEEEIEVDIDALPREALWALDSYALSVLPHIHGAKEKPTAAAAAAAAAAAQQQQALELQQLAAAGSNAPGAAHAAAAARGADSGSQGEVGSKGSAEGKSAL